jgi:hypothetical protein
MDALTVTDDWPNTIIWIYLSKLALMYVCKYIYCHDSHKDSALTYVNTLHTELALSGEMALCKKNAVGPVMVRKLELRNRRKIFLRYAFSLAKNICKNMYMYSRYVCLRFFSVFEFILKNLFFFTQYHRS